MVFNWNEFYLIFKERLEKLEECTVGRYAPPAETNLPYCDVSVEEIVGGDYDLEGNEGSQNVLIAIMVYAAGSLADSICEEIGQAAKAVMLSYGFQCRAAPVPKANQTDPDMRCWVSKYQRIFVNGEE